MNFNRKDILYYFASFDELELNFIEDKLNPFAMV